jgi:hypothetical protein
LDSLEMRSFWLICPTVVNRLLDQQRHGRA